MDLVLTRGRGYKTTESKETSHVYDPLRRRRRRQRDRSDERASATVRSANRVCSQSGIWLPEERIQCVKTRWGSMGLKA